MIFSIFRFFLLPQIPDFQILSDIHQWKYYLFFNFKNGPFWPVLWSRVSHVCASDLCLSGKDPKDEYLEAMMTEAPGPINFTMFLTMFGEKLNGTDPEEVIRNAFACFDEEGTGEHMVSH